MTFHVPIIFHDDNISESFELNKVVRVREGDLAPEIIVENL